MRIKNLRLRIENLDEPGGRVSSRAVVAESGDGRPPFSPFHLLTFPPLSARAR